MSMRTQTLELSARMVIWFTYAQCLDSSMQVPDIDGNISQSAIAPSLPVTVYSYALECFHVYNS